MADPKFRRLRVLHLVGADGKSAPNPMLVPLLARGNRQRIECQVATFSIGDPRLAVVRQSGLPVHEMALSRQRFSPSAFFDAQKLVAEFKPDVLHAWGSTAQLVARALAGRAKKPIPIVWSVSRTTPLAKDDGWLTRLKFGWNVKFAPSCQRIVYPSAVASATHRRAGLPEAQNSVIAPGVDAERFKPDDAARQRVRQQLELPQDAILIGMYAPFAPEFDHLTFFKAIGELIRINSNLYCVIAGRGTVKGNAPLSAMVGGGVMGTRTRLAGEWTDLSALFNACDIVCSTANSDAARLTLAMSMLCGVMCAATGVGAQGEVIGSYGASVEPGSVDALTRGIRRLLDMPADRKTFMAQQARNHILQNFNMARSIEKYHELYTELVTGVVPVAAAQAQTVDQSQAADIIAKRAAAVALRAQPSAAQPTVEKPVSNDAERAFGSVEQSSAPVQARRAATASFSDQVAAQATDQAPDDLAASTATDLPAIDATSNTNVSNVRRSEIPKDDDFDVMATTRMRAAPQAASAADKNTVSSKVDQSLSDSAHWSEGDAHLLDEIMVEADAETAKANADKAARAAKSAAAKAATNAALAAALAGNPDAAKTIDPKMLAAALNLSNISGGAQGSPRVVAGKAPPAPSSAKTPTSTSK